MPTYILRWYMKCSGNVWLCGISSRTTYLSTRFRASIAITALIYTSAELQTCSSLSTSYSLLNTCQADSRLSGGLTSVTKLELIFCPMKLLLFGSSMPTKHVPVPEFSPSVPGLVSFYTMSLIHAVLFCVTDSKILNPNFALFTSYTGFFSKASECSSSHSLMQSA